MKTVLLTGANGFLGSHILEKLIEDKKFNIIITIRKLSNLSKISHLSQSLFDIFCLENASLEEVFKHNKIDVVIHCATKYGRNNENNMDIFGTNLLFSLNLLEFSKKYKVKLFINMDSYFTKFNCDYLEIYNISKKMFKDMLKIYSKDVNIVNVMIEHMYGPRDNNDKMVYQMIKKIAIEKEKFVCLTSGEQKRDFIYVKDAANCICYLIGKYINKSIGFIEFPLGTGKSTSIKSMVSMIKSLSNSTTQLLFGEIPYRKNEIMDSYAQISENNKIGWGPKISLEEGLKLTINNL